MIDDLHRVHGVDSPIKTRDQDEVVANTKDVPGRRHATWDSKTETRVQMSASHSECTALKYRILAEVHNLVRNSGSRCQNKTVTGNKRGVGGKVKVCLPVCQPANSFIQPYPEP